MTTEKKSDANTEVPVTGAPVPVVDEVPSAGPGQVVVTSPTGARSVVFDYQVDGLKAQGYKAG